MKIRSPELWVPRHALQWRQQYECHLPSVHCCGSASFLPHRSATRYKSFLQTQKTCLHPDYMGHFRERTHFSTASFRVEFNPVMWCYYSCLFFWLSWLFTTSAIHLFLLLPSPDWNSLQNVLGVYLLPTHSQFRLESLGYYVKCSSFCFHSSG